MHNLNLLKELNVLYVDDDKNACKSLKNILKYYFKEVFISYNGRDALKIYEDLKCHLLIVDYDMPIMDGYEFLSKIREQDHKTAAIIVSSYDDKDKLKNAIKLNLLDYIIKPYELAILKKVLHLFLNHVIRENLLTCEITKDCFYSFNLKSIKNGNNNYKLTRSEINIFEQLLENKNKIVLYEHLFYTLGSENTKSLASMIYKINKRLPSKIIENIKDVGYRIKI